MAKISDLKNRLSYYLRFVRRGQPILVCDRDRVIARIEPVREAVSDGDENAWTAELARRGVLRPPTVALRKDWLQRRPQTRGDVVQALLDERESGR